MANALTMLTNRIKLFRPPEAENWVALPARLSRNEADEPATHLAMFLLARSNVNEMSRMSTLSQTMMTALHSYASSVTLPASYPGFASRYDEVALTHRDIRAATANAIDYKVSFNLTFAAFWYGTNGYPLPDLSAAHRSKDGSVLVLPGPRPTPYDVGNYARLAFRYVLNDPRALVSVSANIPSAKSFTVELETIPVRYSSLVEMAMQFAPTTRGDT